MLYDLNASAMLLGCFCQSPFLVQKSKYNMKVDDWMCNGVEESEFYAIIYKAIYNLTLQSDVKEIDAPAIDKVVENFPDKMAICQQYDYISYIEQIKGLANVENIDMYYDIVRKFSMLRAYKQAGFDISPIYDELKDEASQRAKLNNYSMGQIADVFIVKQNEIKNQFVYADDVEHYIIGTDFQHTKDLLKQRPNIGLPFQSKYLNELFNGIQGLTIVSAASGVGKSSMSVGDCCMNGAVELYNSETKEWDYNPSYMGATLFINTEMEIRTELESMFIAFMADIPRQHILRGTYEGDEEERADYAAMVLAKNPIYTVTLPNYNCEMIGDYIDYYVYNHNVRLVCFDYIYTSTAVGAELTKVMQIPAREDLVLQEVSNYLKELSLKHGIPIRTSTQLNRKAQEDYGTPDESFIAGAIGIVRKANNFAVIQPMTQKLLADLEPFEADMQANGYPTHVVTVVKGRNSAYPKQYRIYIQMDLGTLRLRDLFVTDRDIQGQKVNALTITNPNADELKKRWIKLKQMGEYHLGA